MPEPVGRLHDWVGADDLVSENGLLRAAVLHWGLSIAFPRGSERPAIDAVIDHELRADRFDPHGLLVLAENERGEEALSVRSDVVKTADSTGHRSIGAAVQALPPFSATALPARDDPGAESAAGHTALAPLTGRAGSAVRPG